MTEESDDQDNPNTIVEHKLAWRSKSKLQYFLPTQSWYHYEFTFSELDHFIEVLEKRIEKKQLLGPVAKKIRRVGHPSESSPPTDAPPWAVTANEGLLVLNHCNSVVHDGLQFQREHHGMMQL